MEKFESTDTLMELLESGKYKRLVMENEEDILVSEESFDLVVENFKARTSRPDNYDYITRRQIKSK